MKLNGKKSIVWGLVVGTFIAALISALIRPTVGAAMIVGVALWAGYGMYIGSDDNKGLRWSISLAACAVLLGLLGFLITNSHYIEWLTIVIVFLTTFSGGLVALDLWLMGIAVGLFKPRSS